MTRAIEQLPDIWDRSHRDRPHATLVELHIDRHDGVAIVLDVGDSELARRPCFLDLHLQLVETFGQRVLR